MEQRNGVQLPTVECVKCGSKWIPRTANPKRCPACGKYRWKGNPGEVKSHEKPKSVVARCVVQP